MGEHGVAVPASPRVVLIGLLSLGAASLQGCVVGTTGPWGQSIVPTHHVGNWRSAINYLLTYEYVPPGASIQAAALNSCKPGVAPTEMQCGGHGVCKQWGSATRLKEGDKPNSRAPISFCQCDRDWADPECKTPRKSQFTAFMYSVFLGFFGADLIYLGYYAWAVLKVCTLGGLGLWYVYDIVRIGCAPVYASDFRLAPDMPHYAFVICVTGLFLAVGFAVAFTSSAFIKAAKRREVMLKAGALISSEEPQKEALAYHGYGSVGDECVQNGIFAGRGEKLDYNL